MLYYIIPCRKGSKRLPKKNRKLIDYTLQSLPKKVRDRTIITTDDPWIWDHIKNTDFKLHKRDPKFAQDETSTRAVLRHLADEYNFDDTDDFVLLYVTYPERKFGDVEKAIQFYKRHDAKSMLCKQEPQSHPYLCMYEEDNHRGSQIVEHDLYRYQDYPNVFELSHYIAITQVGELDNVNPNLYNGETIYYSIDSVIDVDHPTDLQKYLDENNNGK